MKSLRAKRVTIDIVFHQLRPRRSDLIELLLTSGWEFDHQNDTLTTIATGDDFEWESLQISAEEAREILQRRDLAGEVLGVTLQRVGTKFCVNVNVWKNGDATFFLLHPRAIIQEEVLDFDWYRTNLIDAIIGSTDVLSIAWEELYV